MDFVGSESGDGDEAGEGDTSGLDFDGARDARQSRASVGFVSKRSNTIQQLDELNMDAMGAGGAPMAVDQATGFAAMNHASIRDESGFFN